MIRTVIVQYVTDDTFEYQKGDRVRVKMKPKDEDEPEWASEYIGEIMHIADGYFFLHIGIDTRLLKVKDIDRMRFAEPNETFENTWEF